jgi:hypothetical protein
MEIWATNTFPKYIRRISYFSVVFYITLDGDLLVEWRISSKTSLGISMFT